MNVTTRNKDTDYQILSAYLAGKIQIEELTEHQSNRLKRCKVAYDMLLDAQANSVIIKRLQREFEINESNAFRDLNMTEALFGNLRETNKNIKRQIAENMALEAYRLAKAKEDIKSMNGAVKNYITATGVDKEDMDLPEFDKLQPNIYTIVLDEEVRTLFLDFINQKGSIDLTKLIESAEDANIIEDNTKRTD